MRGELGAARHVTAGEERERDVEVIAVVVARLTGFDQNCGPKKTFESSEAVLQAEVHLPIVWPRARVEVEHHVVDASEQRFKGLEAGTGLLEVAREWIAVHRVERGGDEETRCGRTCGQHVGFKEPFKCLFGDSVRNKPISQ